jgi:hypothetical protein
MSIKAWQWTLSWATWIQSTPSYPISVRSILILSSYLCLYLPSGLFLSCFPIIILYAFFLFPMHVLCKLLFITKFTNTVDWLVLLFHIWEVPDSNINFKNA